VNETENKYLKERGNFKESKGRAKTEKMSYEKIIKK